MPRTIIQSFRSDDHLINILDQVASWTVCDPRGMDLYTTATLRAAVIEATAYSAVLYDDVSIHRQKDGVVVSRERIQRLMEGIP